MALIDDVVRYFEGEVYTCRNCRTHIAPESHVHKDEYYERKNKTFHFCKQVVNTVYGDEDSKWHGSGWDTFRKIYCMICDTSIGRVHTIPPPEFGWFSRRYVEGEFRLNLDQLALEYSPDGEPAENLKAVRSKPVEVDEEDDEEEDYPFEEEDQELEMLKQHMDQFQF